MASDLGQDSTPSLRDRFAARQSRWRARFPGFALIPEPRSMGLPDRGRALCAGHYQFGGYMVEAGQTGIWSVDAGGDGRFEAARQSFVWLDDLAALGSATALAHARAWTEGWVVAFGRGQGPGWTPALTGRRLIRLLHHLQWLNGPGDLSDLDRKLGRSLDHHLRFLRRRARSAPPGLARFEALCAQIIAALTLSGREGFADPALQGLELACRQQIGPDGGVLSRNPEELLAIFELLVWADKALSDRGRLTRPAHQEAVERAAHALRALRHADGGLARFHSGRRGISGAAESALGLAGIRPAPVSDLAMGYARLARGRTTVIVDAAPPPLGRVSRRAHASTLAFELTSARRPVIVNCGAGQDFGAEWDRAARATASHSTLGLDGYSSARLGQEANSRDLLVDGPRDVPLDLDLAPGPARLIAVHEGYAHSHGLLHLRRLDLGTDGRGLAGEDMLTATNEADKRRFARALERAQKAAEPGIAYSLRFHLHPDVDARLDLGGRAVSLKLPSGELWIFRHSSAARMSLDPSVYLENTRATPVATQQIVLAGRALTPESSVKWSLAKAEDAPAHLRDLGPDAAD
ncbi:MAG: heparinase II/III family protein [Mangrovicoccus sp.]|nr:heparinase II/III family protein [Mangrovicoccus sp.]